MTTPSILFVCLGNICRSPLADGALRHRVRQLGLGWTVDSAGTGGWHTGEPPDRRAMAIAKAHGVDIAGLRARQVRRADFERFDLILAMDHDNFAGLKAIAAPDARAELCLALDLVAGREGEAVADPLCGRPSVGKGVSALRWLVVAPMCPAYLRGFAWPLALMPFARFRSLPITRTRSAGVGRVLLLRRFQPACCVSSVCPFQLVWRPGGAISQAAASSGSR